MRPVGNSRNGTVNVRTLCLAILYFGEATGYEIKKMSVEGKYSHFVDASFGSIYPALAKLENDNCVTVREEPQPGKPARKIYSITEIGKQTFIEALHEAPGRDVFRSAFLLVSMCADLLPRQQVAKSIDERLEDLQAEIDHLEGVAASTDNAGVAWTVRYGATCLTASRDFLRANRGELEAISEGSEPQEFNHKQGNPAAAE